jgi:hypothetical protein
MGFTEFSDCKFSDAVGCSNEHSSEWLYSDEHAVGGSDGCELDHYGKYGGRCQENACTKAWKMRRNISIVSHLIGQRMRCCCMPDVAVCCDCEG